MNMQRCSSEKLSIRVEAMILSKENSERDKQQDQVHLNEDMFAMIMCTKASRLTSVHSKKLQAG